MPKPPRTKPKGDVVREAKSKLYHLVAREADNPPNVWTACGLNLEPEARPSYGPIIAVTCTRCWRSAKGIRRRRNPA